MKRSPVVLGGTALGLVGVLGYHTASTPTALSSPSAASSTAAASTTATTRTATTSRSASATKASATKRTVTGSDVNFRYGDLQLKVTATGSRITSVSVVKLDETDQHSAEIDQVAIPQLTQEAVGAQSAKIDGVSGASYTSQAYEQSLQSALDKLGVTSSAA